MKDDPELTQLYEEDQADRRVIRDGGPLGPDGLKRRDRAREARVREFYRAGSLRTGADYYHTAIVLQHAPAPEDHLLAHELCIVAVSKGEERARWLAAASEDRFLMIIGRPQRFGTQYRGEGPGMALQLHEVAPDVTDGLRREFGVSSLAEAQAREAALNKGPKADRDEAAGAYRELVRKIRSGEIKDFDQVREALGLDVQIRESRKRLDAPSPF